MSRIKFSFWTTLALLSLLWLIAEPAVFAPASFFALRESMMQYSGILATGCMSVAMILALRPRWPERWLGGLDRMYRLHKWFGIAALAVAVIHWLWAQGPKWAVGLGLLARPARGGRGAPDGAIEQLLRSLRGPAEGWGEWAFYGAVVLIVVALAPFIPYRFFYRTHRILAALFLVLVFHTLVLTRIDYWTAPLGIVMAVLLAWGSWAAAVALLGRVGRGRQVRGTIADIVYYPDVHALETAIDVPDGWPGHKPGQFAFAMSDAAEGAHPYTIASAWDERERRIVFITKELGDHTGRLRETLRIGQPIRIEGPYGYFTFDDDRPHQIWIGAGIGITPFVAQMKHLARAPAVTGPESGQQRVDLFHCTAEYDETAIARLTADAAAAHVRLHVLHDPRDGRLTGDAIRRAVPDWRDASIWFCGPAGFGAALRRDFAAQGFPVAQHFHQELFAMR